jgi:putative 2OG-Fe(II) oxygenase
MKYKKFLNDGFINLGGGFFSQDTLKELTLESKKLLESVIKNKSSLDSNITVNDFNDTSIGSGGYALKRVDQHSSKISKILKNLFEDKKINTILENFLGKGFKIQTLSLRKSSTEDHGLGLHQDGPGQINLVIFLDDNEEINGSTVFLKNSHLINARVENLKLLAPPFFLRVYKLFLSYIHGKQGDVCLFINRTWHGRYPSNNAKSKLLYLIACHPEGTKYGSEYDDLYSEDYLNQLGACKFRERIDHRMGTKKINEKEFEIDRSGCEIMSLKFEEPKKNSISNLSFLNLIYISTLMLIMYPGRFIKRLFLK